MPTVPPSSHSAARVSSHLAGRESAGPEAALQNTEPAADEASEQAAEQALPRFHLAFPVRDLAEARQFYGGLLGCAEGRSSPEWVDFNFYGHQIVAHLCVATPRGAAGGESAFNEVDGENVPVRHFGVILTLPQWEAMTQKLRAAQVKFIIEPQIRFKGLPGEQATCFFLDPSGNALELKAFADEAMVFAR